MSVQNIKKKIKSNKIIIPNNLDQKFIRKKKNTLNNHQINFTKKKRGFGTESTAFKICIEKRQ